VYGRLGFGAVGDSWHGMDWDYDELQFTLGVATSNATTVPDSNPPLVLPAIPLRANAWSLFVDQRTPPPGQATLSADANDKPTPESPPSQRIDIKMAAPNIDGIDLQQNGLSFHLGGYQLSFWARASRDKTPVTLDTRKESSPWSGYGLFQQILLSQAWAQYLPPGHKCLYLYTLQPDLSGIYLPYILSVQQN
jgi:hypothetical protein